MTRDTHLNALNLSFSSGSLSGLYHFRLTFCIVRVLIIVIILLSPFLSPEREIKVLRQLNIPVHDRLKAHGLLSTLAFRF